MVEPKYDQTFTSIQGKNIVAEPSSPTEAKLAELSSRRARWAIEPLPHLAKNRGKGTWKAADHWLHQVIKSLGRAKWLANASLR